MGYYGSNDFVNLKQVKYQIFDVFEKQNADKSTRDLYFEFHKSLADYFNERNLTWWSRTHTYGCSYFCNSYKCFFATDIFPFHFYVRYYTGNSSIDGLKKRVWLNKDDNKGSERIKVKNSADIIRALSFAEAAYRISQDESSRE